MKNWNTDVQKFRTLEEKKVWRLIQLIEYGVENQKISTKQLKKYWSKIKNQIDPINKKLYEFWLWGKTYSPPTSKNWWQPSQLTTIYPTSST